ncbi:Signal transduction histidine kinase [Paramagnetospirillum magnetotacticum MS-1]|uniref:histidine kinase n=1 Tax=Paramagnetospirillum magnetotacticum MS-1 TaxID=272627 RepID=A0A0C2YZ67_PARME|nr:ATP-binding protein [Paramagnetospirillum magnetotacticum]KIL99955.1 Signal transduction histidine kinase [Paramagnetospirillum magnetotacticum MS-1]
MSGFNLFDAEEKSLEQAEDLRRQLDSAPEPVREGIASLVEAYRRSVREQRRLVRVSDRLQAQLASVNQELGKRKAEAEGALEDLKAAQESLVQAEKLASLGALVGGVAHEINTPVGIALSCASHLADSTGSMRKLFEADDISVDDFERFMDTVKDTTSLILSNVERAAELIRSFKQVAVDRTSSERRRFDLATYIRETLFSLGPHLRQAGHSVCLDCPEGVIMDSYPGALSQVLGNFVMNSLVHGFEPGELGTLSIRVERQGTGGVRLIYADDGKGIPEDNLGRIFDPFFTTKRGSGGSGLGLHIVYNLVTGPLGGSVSAESPKEGGTVFTMTMPLSP